jgi:hypothetical protein
MIISAVVSSSESITFRFFTLWLAWTVLLSVSWVDRTDAHDRMNLPLTDFQQATEPDLDEVRADIVPDFEVSTVHPIPADPSFGEYVPPASPPTGLSRAALLSKLSVYRI